MKEILIFKDNNAYLLILYIEFNYNKRFNLNNVKTNLLKLKKIKCSIKEKFIIYCMEQKIKDINGQYSNIENVENNI